MDASIRSDLAPARADRSAGPDDPTPALGLRVALVHDWLTGMRGGEKCLEVLCRAFPGATLHTLIRRPGALSPAIERMAIRTSPLQRIPGVLDHYRKLLPLMPMAARAWDVGDVDLVVSLSHCVAKMVRVPAGVPHVSYCFTPMRYAWDGRDAYLDSWADRPIRKALAGRLLDRLREEDRASSAGVTHFVAISDTIRDRIARCYGRDSRVIRPPVDTDFYRPAPVAREDFYLVVSALVPYKQIEHAVAACTALERPLVVIGAGPERARLERLAGPDVRFLGWQSDESIRDHYRRCRALLFPGEEDFGIAPIEALACEAPVIALGRGGVPETVDGAVGLTYDDPTAEGLLEAIGTWEAAREPFDPRIARERAEALATPVFRGRILDFLAEVAAPRPAVPAPHIAVAAAATAGRP